MPNLYRRGRIAERKIVNDLSDKGFENIRRSAGSRGPADVYACKDGRKYYFQVKSGSAKASVEEIEQLRKLAQQRGGTAVTIHRKDGRNRWRFHGSW
ncbi:MAG: restriction endonuclease [Candidatus Aenigmatarchaeota archaeon]